MTYLIARLQMTLSEVYGHVCCLKPLISSVHTLMVDWAWPSVARSIGVSWYCSSRNRW